MADEKWISGLAGDMPVRDAARRVLTVRLGVVHDRLPQAVFQAEEDVEHVHQLRVGTRRATAALRIFADALPAKLNRRAKRTLRTIRRAAGEARDWDVFLAMIAGRLAAADAKQKRGLDFLLGFGHGRRVVAQGSLQESTHRQGEKLAGILGDLDEYLEAADPGPSLRELAVPTLSQLLGEVEEAATGDLTDYEALHQVRILGKQLRYAMEVFESCFDPLFRDKYYPAVVDMQDILGEANDSYVAVGRLTELKERLQRTQPDEWPGYRPGVEALIRHHQRRLPQQRRRFATWWEKWRASGTEQAFAGLIQQAG